MVRKNANAHSMSNLRDKVAETGHNIAEIGHLARRAANDKLHDIGAAAAARVGRGKEKLMEVEGRLENRIQHQPIKSILVAAGIGLLLGIVFRKL